MASASFFMLLALAAFTQLHLASAARLLLAQAPPSLYTVQDVSTTFTGEVDIVSSHTEALMYFLWSAQMPRRHLDFSNVPGFNPIKLASGNQLVVVGTLDKGSNTIFAASVQIQASVTSAAYTAASPQQLTSITYILNICGNKNPIDAVAFKAGWTNDQPGAGALTMQNYYSTCSYNKTQFLPNNNIVVGPIDVPCSGQWSSGGTYRYNSTACGSDEIYGWAEYAQNYTKNVLGINFRAFARQVVLLPNLDQCPWAGLGSVGCGSMCYSWFSGTYAMQLDTVYHELGHNLGNQHSTTPGNEYGDCSCPMGACESIRCFNAPQMYRLQWALPVAVVTSVVPGRWQTFALPPTFASDTNFLQIIPAWTVSGKAVPGVNVKSLFVSYRSSAGGFDKGLISTYADKVFVHEYNGTAGLVTADKPQLDQMLTPGQSYADPTTGLVIREFSRVSGVSATVGLCVPNQLKETNCFDGLDNDCNGLSDAQDPACSAILSAALPSTPPPPPPPRASPPPLLPRATPTSQRAATTSAMRTPARTATPAPRTACLRASPPASWPSAAACGATVPCSAARPAGPPPAWSPAPGARSNARGGASVPAGLWQGQGAGSKASAWQVFGQRVCPLLKPPAILNLWSPLGGGEGGTG